MMIMMILDATHEYTEIVNGYGLSWPWAFIGSCATYFGCCFISNELIGFRSGLQHDLKNTTEFDFGVGVVVGWLSLPCH
jgi:hypothetical protein